MAMIYIPPSGGGGLQDLQSVTDVGNQTSNMIIVGDLQDQCVVLQNDVPNDLSSVVAGTASRHVQLMASDDKLSVAFTDNGPQVYFSFNSGSFNLGGPIEADRFTGESNLALTTRDDAFGSRVNLFSSSGVLPSSVNATRFGNVINVLTGAVVMQLPPIPVSGFCAFFVSLDGNGSITHDVNSFDLVEAHTLYRVIQYGSSYILIKG